MADAASVTVSATVLPDEIAKTISGSMTVTPADANDKWYVKVTNVTTTAGDLIAGSFISEEAVGTSHDAVHTADKVKFLFIKNTGTTDGSSSTTDGICVALAAATPAHDLGQSIVIGAGESWYARLPNETVADIHAVGCNQAVSGAASGNVQCIVAALIDDVA